MSKNVSRRRILSAGVAAGAAACAAAPVAAASLTPRSSKGVNVYGPNGAPAPEFRLDDQGQLQINPDQQTSYTACFGCVTQCSVRVRLDKKSGEVIRVAGNPFSPMSATEVLPFEKSLCESFVALSRHQESGIAGRATACGRGVEAARAVSAPQRVLTPLKRVGPRNGGQWQSISWEQLITEICEGGNLFGEGEVAGLRQLRDFAPIDPAQPALGPKLNQVAMLSGVADGRQTLINRFMKQAYGTINAVGHGSYCGGAYRSGSGAVFGDKRRMPHAKPDFENIEFCIFIGTAPGNAGNPFKRQAAALAEARTTGKLDYVVIDPVLTQSQNAACGQRSRWIPIRPASDGALAMAMIRWILEQERHDAKFLSAPNAAVAQAQGEASWSNASHLVITSSDHPRSGRLLRASDLGRKFEGERYGDGDSFMVIDAASGELTEVASSRAPARLFQQKLIEVPGGTLQVETALSQLRRAASEHSLETYSAACGVPVETIVELARKFTSHGKRAAVNLHGGMMSANGFANAHALVMLNVLIGNLNRKGGTLINAGGYPEAGKGPRYQLAGFEGEVSPKGTPLGRNQPYEKSADFAQRKQAGAAYPARDPWFPNAPQLATEWLAAAFSGYPYSLKALLLWNTNPIYAIPGLRSQIGKDLADPKKLPLIVAIDPFINETTAFADYIVPDTVFVESWGWARAWGGVPSKAVSARWPLIEPRTAQLPDGQAMSADSFVIALATGLGLPGFGRGALRDREGRPCDLLRAEDWYLRAGANIAFADEPVAPANDEDLRASGVERLRPMLESRLGADEWRRVANVLAHGGRFQAPAQAFKGEVATHRFPRAQLVYNEEVAATRNSYSGRANSGVPRWNAPGFADGSSVESRYPRRDWPLQLVSFKSPLQSPFSITSERLRALHPKNEVLLHPEDGRAMGLADGSAVLLQTPGGQVRVHARFTEGIARGVAALEHGFGHREFGARSHRVDGTAMVSNASIGAGVNLNDLGVSDPSRGAAKPWLDPLAGSAVRNGLPARIRPLA